MSEQHDGNAQPARRRLVRKPGEGAEAPPAELKPAEVARLARAAVEELIPEPGAARPPPPGEEGSGEEKPWMNRGQWGTVIEDLRNVEVEKTYQRLRRDLSLGEGATEYGVVLKAADLAEQNAFEASVLARAAKLEQERVDLECDKELELLRTLAREELHQERLKAPEAPAEEEASSSEESAAGEEKPKPKGRGKKAAEPKVSRRPPTIQDVEDRILANWPPLVKSLKMRKAEIHGARAMMESLAERWASRCATLRVMAEKVAGHR